MIESRPIDSPAHCPIDVGIVVRMPAMDTARALLEQVAGRIGMNAVARGRVTTAMSELLNATFSSSGRLADEVHIRYLVDGEALFVRIRSQSRDSEPVDPDSSSLAIVAALMDGFEVADDGTAIIRKDLAGARD